MKKKIALLLACAAFTGCATNLPYSRDKTGQKVWLDQKRENHNYYTIYNDQRLERDRYGANVYPAAPGTK
jgi:hypothetical protein